MPTVPLILKLNWWLCVHSMQKNLSVSSLPAALYQTVFLTQEDFPPWTFQTWWVKKTEHSVLGVIRGPNLYLANRKHTFSLNNYVDKPQKILLHIQISENTKKYSSWPLAWQKASSFQGKKESFPAIYKTDGNNTRCFSKRFSITFLHDL